MSVPKGKQFCYMANKAITMLELLMKFKKRINTYVILNIPWIINRDTENEEFDHKIKTILKLPDLIEFDETVRNALKLLLKFPKQQLPFDISDIVSAISRAIERKHKLSLISLLEFTKIRKIKPPASQLFLLVKYKPFDDSIYKIAKEAGYSDPGYDDLPDLRDLTKIEYIGYRITQHILSYSNRTHMLFLLDYWRRVKYKNCTYDAAEDLCSGMKYEKVIYDGLKEPQESEHNKQRALVTATVIYEKYKNLNLYDNSLDQFIADHFTKVIPSLFQRLG